MDFSFSPELEAFRRRVRELIAKEASPRWASFDVGEWEHVPEAFQLAREFERRLATQGLYAATLPVEHGGGGLLSLEYAVLSEELAYQRAPSTGFQHNALLAGNLLHKFGTAWQQEELLRPLAAAEALICQGFTEPQAGSDLASLQTRAKADGDGFLLSGQKTFVTGAHLARWCLVPARTDPDAPKHRGLSLFLIDLDALGVTIRPLMNMLGHHHFNDIFLDGVRVDAGRMIGRQNDGWRCLMAALAIERSNIGTAASARRMLDDLTGWLRQQGRRASPLPPDVQRHRLADLYARCAIARLLAYQIASLQDRGQPMQVQGTMAKIINSQLAADVATFGIGLLGLYGQLSKGARAAGRHLRGRLSHSYMAATILPVAGGSVEVMRSVVAQQRLGLPRE